MKTRIIHTKIWEDDAFGEYSLEAKLLFIYFLTNTRVSLTSAYEIPKKYITFETGLTTNQIDNVLPIIESKITYQNNWVVIKNAKKYQDYSKGNPKQKAAFQKEFDRLPDFVKRIIYGQENLTSSELVKNQSQTSQGLDINKKLKIINRKEEIKKQKSKVVKKNKHEITDEEIAFLRSEEFYKKLTTSEFFIKYLIKRDVLSDMVNRIKDYCQSKNVMYADYEATLRNWIRKSIEQNQGKWLTRDDWKQKQYLESFKSLPINNSLAKKITAKTL